MSVALLPKSWRAGLRVVRRGSLFLCLQVLLAGSAIAAPVVTNVRGAQRIGTRLVDVYYDLSERATVRLEVSSDSGSTWHLVPVQTVNPAAGSFVPAGKGNHILWDAGADWPGQYSSAVRFKVTAIGVGDAPFGMALIPAGSFQMGDSFGEGWEGEFPVHTVYVSAFYMDKYEVSKALWDEVYNWATNHGYEFNWFYGSGKAANHPIYDITWYDAVKWCNARSEKEGRTPAYYTSSARTEVYRSGWVDVRNDWVRWDAGYRLPTEAEWEKAARGGLSGKRFPWGDEITHSQANYYSSAGYSYDTSPTREYHPLYNTGDDWGYTSPVGAFAPNGYGLYDMAGNVWEWCWDWFDSYGSGSQTDPRGPVEPSGYWGTYRVLRGGSWDYSAYCCRVASRSGANPDRYWDFTGFRAVLPPGQQ